MICIVTYQSNQEKKDLKAPAQGGVAGDVPVSHGGHGHHQEVHTVPVGQALAVVEVRRITRIFKLSKYIKSMLMQHYQTLNLKTQHQLVRLGGCFVFL